MTKKKILYFDMDGVLADFSHAISNVPEYLISNYKGVDNIPHIFRNLPVVEGAQDAVDKLKQSDKFEMFIATTASWDNISCASDKRAWLQDHFGDIFKKKMMITHRKDLLIGDYLIDDRTANGAKDFKGEHIHFGWDYKNKKWNKYKDWGLVLDLLFAD